MLEAIILVVSVFFSALVLFGAAKVTSVNLTIKEAVIAIVGSSLFYLVPTYGWILAILALFLILKRLKRANIFPDIILMVFVCGIFNAVLNAGLEGYL